MSPSHSRSERAIRVSAPIVGGVGLLLLLAACGQARDDLRHAAPPKALGSAKQAIVDSVDDANTPEANAVVRLNNNCTGTLITPQLVLTALHCIRLDEDPTCRITLPTVAFGAGILEKEPPANLALWTRESADAVTTFADCLNRAAGRGTDVDLALVYLKEPVLNVKPVRPAVNDPTYPADVTLYNGAIAGWGRRGMANDAIPAQVRQIMTLPSPFELDRSLIQLPPYNGFGRLEADPPGNDVRFGDSGGPLFRTLPSGERQVIGVLSGFFHDTWWADVAAPAARSWIVTNALAENRVARSSAWYARHGKSSATMWFGEADYTGACDRARDKDCDLWDDAHDNCPFVTNPAQDEIAPGGIGKACAKCPYDPKNDEDGDGVCGPSAPGYPALPYNVVDNCPVTKNSDQANCNEISETTLQHALLGDACDPVPCPKIELADGRVEISKGLPFNPYVGVRGFGRIVRDTFMPRPVRPSIMNEKGNPIAANVPEVVVASRFCQSDDDRDFKCIIRNTIRNEQVDLVERYDKERPWHRIRHKQEGAAGFLAPGTDVAWPFTAAASTNGLTRRVWGFQADYNNWLAQNLIPIPTADGRCYQTDIVGAGTCLDGYLWHHARTPIGYTEPVAGGFVVGVRGEDGRDLSNMFVPLTPDSPAVFTTKVVGKYRKLWWWQKLRQPLAPFLDDPRPASHARLVGVDDDSSVLMVHDIGGGEEVGPHMSEDAQRSVVKYVVAASLEPEGSAHQISKDVEAAVLSEDGTRVLDLLVSDTTSLRTGTENGWSVASEPSLDAPTPRTGFTAFFSPMLGAVVVAGGTDAAGAPDGSVYVYRFGIGWHRVQPDVEFVDVRAAIFSPTDGMLWIVDAVKQDKVQIVRIDPLTGQKGRVATFAWDATLYPTHTLGLDSTGKVLLVASSTNTSKTMRLEVNPLDGKIVGRGLLQHEFPQSTPPVSAFGETSFVREDAEGQVVGIDRSHIVPSEITLSVAGMFK